LQLRDTVNSKFT